MGTIFFHIITVLPCSPLLYGHLFSLLALLIHRDMDHHHQAWRQYTPIDFFTIAHSCLTLSIFHQTVCHQTGKVCHNGGNQEQWKALAFMVYNLPKVRKSSIDRFWTVISKYLLIAFLDAYSSFLMLSSTHIRIL